MRAFSRWFTTAAVDTLAACDASAASTGTATGITRSSVANAQAPATRIHPATHATVTVVLRPAPVRHATNAHRTPSATAATSPVHAGQRTTCSFVSTMSATAAWKNTPGVRGPYTVLIMSAMTPVAIQPTNTSRPSRRLRTSAAAASIEARERTTSRSSRHHSR